MHKLIRVSLVMFIKLFRTRKVMDFGKFSNVYKTLSGQNCRLTLFLFLVSPKGDTRTRKSLKNFLNKNFTFEKKGV